MLSIICKVSARSSKKPLCGDTSPVVNSWCNTGYRGPTHMGCVVSPPGSQVFVREEVSPAGGFAFKKTAEVKKCFCSISSLNG